MFSPPSRPSRKKCCSAPKASCSPSRRWEAGCRLCQQSCQLQPKESSSPPQWAKLINGCDCQFPSEEPLEHVPGFSLQQRPRMSEWECAAISGSQGSAHPCEPAQRGPPALFAKGAKIQRCLVSFFFCNLLAVCHYLSSLGGMFWHIPITPALWRP